MSYGENYRLEYQGHFGEACQLSIYNNGYSGPVITLSGATDPFTVTYFSEKDYKFTPIVGSEAVITLNSSTDFSLAAVYTSNERQYLIKHYVDGVLNYSGFIKPDDAAEPYSYVPYAVKLTATDALATLKGIPYVDDNGKLYYGKQTFLEVIVNCLKKTGLDLPISTCVNIYEASMSTGLNDDPLTQAKIDSQRYRDENNTPYSCYDVLQAAVTQFSATIRQVNGRFDITNIAELGDATQRRRYYTSAGVFQNATTEGTTRSAPTKGQLELINSDHTIRIDKPFRKVEAYYLYGMFSSVLANGTFLNYNNGTFENWTNVGGLSIDGTYLTGAKVLTLFSASQYLKSAPIALVNSDTLTLSGNLITFLGNKARIKVVLGEYQLKQDGTWAKTDSYIEITPPSPDRPVYYEMGARFEITSSPAPIGGNVYIQVYGAIKGGFPGTTNSVQYNIIEVSRGTGDRANKTAKGEVYSIEQAADYTYIPDRILLLHGDKTEVSATDAGGVRPSRTSYVISPEALTSNIYRADGTTLTTTWSRYGKTDNKPLGFIIARNILNNYQKPFRFFEGSFMGRGINPLQAFAINKLPGLKFIVVSGSFNYEKSTAKLVLVEVSNADVAGTEVLYSDFGTSSSTKSISSPAGISVGGGVNGSLMVVPTLDQIAEQDPTTDKILHTGGLVIDDSSGPLAVPSVLDMAKAVVGKWHLYVDETGQGGSVDPPPVGGGGSVDLSSYYTKSDISSILGGTTPLVGYNKPDWDGSVPKAAAAYGWGNHATVGYAVGVPDVSASANSLVKRDANGYVFGKIFNQNFPTQDLTLDKLYGGVAGEGYMYPVSKQSVINFLGLGASAFVAETLQSILARGVNTTTGATFGGKVAVGTSNAIVRFTVSNAGAQALEMDYSASISSMYIEGINRAGGVTDLSMYLAGNSNFKVFTSGIERMKVTGAGHVIINKAIGIPTGSPNIADMPVGVWHLYVEE